MKRLVCLILIAGCSATASAADLLDIYHVAKRRDPVYAQAQQQLKAQKTLIGQSRGVLLPQLDLSANTQFNQQNTSYEGSLPPIFSNTGGGGSERYNSNGYTLQLTQPLFNMQAFQRYSQSKDQVLQAKIVFQSAQQALITRVANAYFSVLLAQDSLRVATGEKKALKEQLNRAQREFQVGTASATDRDEAQSRYDLARSSEIQARNQASIARQQLRRIIGQPVPALAPVDQSIKLKRPHPANIDAWSTRAGQTNLDVLASRAGVKVARQEVEAQKGKRYPTLDVVAFHDRQTGRQFGLRNTAKTNAIGLQLNYNLFSGGTRYYQIKQAAAQENKSEDSLVDAMRGAELAAGQAYLQVQNSVSQVRADKQALKSSQTSLKSTRVGLRVGTRTFVDVLNSLQQVYSAQRDLLQARYNYLINRLQLKAAIGSLSINDLKAVNSLLNNQNAGKNREKLPGQENMPDMGNGQG